MENWKEEKKSLNKKILELERMGLSTSGTSSGGGTGKPFKKSSLESKAILAMKVLKDNKDDQDDHGEQDDQDDKGQ